MKDIFLKSILFFFIFVAALTKTYSQCTPNNIEFKGVDKVFNTACGDVSYQDIRDVNPSVSGRTYRWEVSFKGGNYTVVKNGINPITSEELAKSDITNYILVPNSNASGDYRIRRVVNSTSGCSNSSEPAYLYYAQNSASLSGGTITGTTVTCMSTSGTLTLSGHTGPILRWERAPVSTGIWEIIANTTNTYTYTNVSESYCYRALVENICDKTGSDLYSSTLCVTANSTPIVTTAPQSQSVCLGSSLNLSVTATSVLTPSYQWRKNGVNINGATSQAFSIPVADFPDAGSYDVVVSNTCGTTTSSTALVSVNPLPIVSLPGNSIICAGTAVSASSFSSNPAGATYTWTNSNPAIGLAASGSGNVSGFTAVNSTSAPISAIITVTPSLNGCPGPSLTYTITVNPQPVAIVPGNITVCSAATVPSSSFSSSPAGATYTWTNSNTSIGLAANGNGNVPSFTAINSSASAVTATITVTPVFNGCTGTPSIYTITVNPLPAIISATAEAESDCGSGNGKITISATGALPLEYSIDGGSTFVQNGGSFIKLAAGSYTVAVRNTNGCIVVGNTVTVTSPGAPPAPEIDPYTNPVCEGSALILTVKNHDPSLTYTWTGPSQFTATGYTVTIPDADPSMAGSYAVTATSGLCVGQPTVFNVSVTPLPVVTVPQSLTYCSGSTVPVGTFISTPAGATYTWTNSNPEIGLAANGTSNVPGFTAVNNTNSPITATITVTPFLNGCNGPAATFTITINPLLVVMVPGNLNYCHGATIPASNFTSTMAGATYSWTLTGLGPTINGSGNTPSFTAINSSSVPITGTVSVTAFLNGCNGPTASYSITVNPLPKVNVPPNTTVCPGTVMPVYTFSSTPAGAAYFWTNSNTDIGLAASGNGSLPAFTAANNSTSPITATISIIPVLNNCSGQAYSYTITVNPMPSLIIPNNTSVCVGENIPSTNFISSQAGWGLTWTNSNAAIGLASSGTGNIPGFTSTNSTGTVISATIILTPSLNGCAGPSSTYTITVNPLPTIISSAVTNESQCNIGDGTITITASGTQPLEYSINGGGTFVMNGGNFTGLAAGSYSVAVRNASGCIFTGPTLSVASPGAPPQPNINAYVSPVCEGEPLILSIQNPDPLATYRWTGPLGFVETGSSIIRSNSNPSMSGTYAVTASINSCVSVSRIFSIAVRPLPSITIPGNLSFCSGSAVPETIFNSTLPGTTIRWTNSNPEIGLTASGSGNLPNFTAINNTTSPITATIIVTPFLNNCTGPSSTYTITINPAVSIKASISSTNIICYGSNNGSIRIAPVSGGFGIYEYSINGGISWQNSTNFGGLAPGSYVLLGRDAAYPECITVISPDIMITQPTTPRGLSFTRYDVSCFGGQNGSLQITPVGGTAPYTYSWSGGQTTKDINGLKEGIYTVSVTDLLGCVYTESISIRQPAAPLRVSFVKTDAGCFGNQDGSIDISVTGGVLPYAYKWSNNKNTEDIQNLAAATYTLTVIDANGCTETQIITINQPDVLKVSLTVKNTICKTSNDGMISAIITGGTKPYTLKWAGLSITENTISNLKPGKYELFITDAKGCTNNITAEILANNCPPVAVDDPFKTDEEIPVSGSVALNDFDRQGEDISFSITSNPKNGKIIFTSDGGFVYTPNVGFWGVESIPYRLCNTSGLCAAATLIIEVIPFTIVNLTPSFSNVREGKKGTVTAMLMRPFKDDVIIRVSYKGTAIQNRDYILLDQFQDIRIPRGKILTTEKITIAALTDDEQEGDKEVLIDISATSDPLVRIGTGAVVIINDVYPPDPLVPQVNNQLPLNPDITPDPLVSPNGDGQGNDFLKVENIVSFPDNVVLIFNRWGNEVFRLKGYNESDRVFKGYANTGLLTNSNSPLADGVYYFVITTNRTVNGLNVSQLNKGYLILKR